MSLSGVASVPHLLISIDSEMKTGVQTLPRSKRDRPSPVRTMGHLERLSQRNKNTASRGTGPRLCPLPLGRGRKAHPVGAQGWGVFLAGGAQVLPSPSGLLRLGGSGPSEGRTPVTRVSAAPRGSGPELT